jgi:hypothetical protein
MKSKLSSLLIMLALITSIYPALAQTTNVIVASLQKPALLTTGMTAYVRVKDYFTQQKPQLFGEATNDTIPAGIETKLQFGDAVKLGQKKDGFPTYWLVTKDQTQEWIPYYVLTTNQAEIKFLKENDRIPKSMTFIYNFKGAFTIACGRSIMEGPFAFVVDSPGGMPIIYKGGRSPCAIEGNAVLFDNSVVAAKYWTADGKDVGPPVFDNAKKAFQLSPACLYYCVTNGDNQAFECLDLVALKVRK